MTTDPTPDPADRLESIRRALVAVAADRPTPEQIAGWNTADKEMAQRIRAALPGVPLHHAYAVLQALRVTERLDAAAAGPAVSPPPALTEVGRLRAQVEVLQQDAERDRGLAKVGARCMRDGHQGLIEQGRAVIEGWCFALSTTLDLGTGAPWDAIHERAKESAAHYRHAADAIEHMQGYPHLILPEEIVAGLRLLATGAQPEPGSPAYTRRLATGERDEQQAQQDGAETRPTRGDQFEQWLKTQRDLCFGHASTWGAVDGLLDQYRLHADTGTPLGQHACEGRTVGDCDCLEQPVKKPPMDPVHILGIEADDRQQPETRQSCACGQDGCEYCDVDEVDDEEPEVVHGCPPDSSGLTPCCGRTPFELPLTDRISSEVPVTCTTPPAVVAELGKEN